MENIVKKAYEYLEDKKLKRYKVKHIQCIVRCLRIQTCGLTAQK